MTVYNAKRFLLDILYPNKCPFCNGGIAFNQYYCPDCPENLGLLTRECEVFENITETFAVFEYSEASSPFVYSIKESGNGCAISAAANLLCEKIGGAELDLITCIPTDSARKRERGYNPPALLAAEISAISGIPHDPKLLVKTRRSEAQKTLTADERRKNLKGVFALNKNRTCPKNILLVDDVCTTGSTLSEAAGILLSCGAENVYAAVVAVVPALD